MQRIVEAYEEHSQRAAPEIAAAKHARTGVSIELDIVGTPPLAAGGDRTPRGARARERRASPTATSRSSSSTRRGSASSTATTARLDEPTDVLSFPIDGDTPTPAGPRELGDVVICPEHTADLREAVVHGVLHLVGMDHETDDGEMLALQRELLSW